MNIRRAVQEDNTQGEGDSLLTSIPSTLILSIFAGVGLGIGLFLVAKLGMR